MLSTRLLSPILALLLCAGSPGANAGDPGSQADSLTDHWAFRLPEPPGLPASRDGETSARHAVDSWIEARLNEKGIEPAPPADDRVVVRRLYVNLLGRPPGHEEVKAFAASTHPNRHERLVDRLLASPQYGERWARHWLDVARYSDTKGYTYAGEEPNFVHAWLYRDWVVNALNADLPYDVFIERQLAADRLLEAGLCNSEDLAAMGFLTLGRRFLGVEQDIIDDRIDVVTRGLLGLTVSCARCHDHKYDPVSAADYYSLYSIFMSSAKRMVPVRASEDAELEERQRALDEAYAKLAREIGATYLDRLEDYLLAALDISQVPGPDFSEIVSKDDLNPAQIRRWYEFLSQSVRETDAVFAPWKALAALPAKRFAAEAPEVLRTAQPADPLVRRALEEAKLSSMEDVVRVYASLLRKAAGRAEENEETPADGASWQALEEVVSGPGSPLKIPRAHIHATEWLFYTSAKEKLNTKQAELERRVLALGNQAPHAVILEDRRPSMNTRVLLRGIYAMQGDEAPRRFLGFLSSPSDPPVTDGSGRLELARAIAAPRNPLIARVLVNRLWHHHFGTGLVRTTSDFGLRSETPSHPELLDFLACRFIEDDWSIKAIQRLLTTSALYGRSSVQETDSRDPENRLLASFPRRRLGFETSRDALLQASGELDERLGGPPAGELTDAGATRRRSLYGRIDRQFLPQTLQVFDFPNPELHSPARSETSVPQQALFFLNSPFVLERARAFARRLDRALPGGNVDNVREKVRLAYRIVYQREPTSAEEERAAAFVQSGLEQDEAILLEPAGSQAGAVSPTPTESKSGSEEGNDSKENAPPEEETAVLTAWERFAQTLLLSNEFLFMD